MENPKMKFVQSILAYAVQRDVSPRKLCNLSNLDFDKLRKNQSMAISDKEIQDLWRHAIALSGDDLFGLHFGESLQLTALGMVGEIIKSSSTVGQGVQIAASLTPLITTLFSMKVTHSKKSFVIELVPSDRLNCDEFLVKQIADLLMVFTVHELDGLLLEKIRPLSVSFPYKTFDEQEYQRVLRCDKIKRGPAYKLTFPGSYWNEPVLSANYDLQSLLLQKLAKSQRSIKNKESMQNRVRDFIHAHTYLGIPALEEVAANFNVTPRSLQRKLQAENVTFQQLTDGIRKTLALHYLRSGSYPLKEISHMLGYNEISAFSRAFKRWTGKTPIHYLE